MKIVYSEVFDSAWKSIKDDLALSAGLTLVFMVGAGVCSKIPVVGTFVTLPFYAGYLRCLMQIRKKETIGYEDFFWGFSQFNRFLHLVLLNVLIGIGAVIGTILLIVPGIWWLIASSFSTQVITLKDIDCIEAMKTSMAMVKGRWWNIFGLMICTGLLVGAGFLCFLVGALIAMPVASLAMIIAAEQLLKDPQVLNPSPGMAPQGPTVPVETTIVPQ